MAEARGSAAWDHTAAVLAMLANCHRDPKKQGLVQPSRFHPYRREEGRRGIPITSDTIGLLKKAFIEDRARAKQWH